MKKLYTLLMILAVLLIAVTACTSEADPTGTDPVTNPATEALTEAVPDDSTTETPTETPTEILTEMPTEESSEAPTEEPTEEPTEAPTEPETEPAVEITDGMMLYYEDFSSYGDIHDLDGTLSALGWVIQTTDRDYAYSDWTAGLSLENGALVVNNYRPDEGFKGKDSYALILGEDYMEPIAEYGDYTLQYDVTYTDASNYKRYICLLTDYCGDAYNSYHFRIGGYANNQAHLGDTWYTFDAVDPTQDLSAKLTENNPEQGTTIAYKLLGIDTPIKDDSAIENFRNVTVTIRIQHDNDLGNIIYMKTAQMEDFVCVSMPRTDADGYNAWETVVGMPGLAFKVGAAINGTMDNIIMWAGLGEMPEDTTVTYPLAK